MLTEATDTTIDIRDDRHPFERAGLGKAPFRFVTHRENWYSACQGHRQPGGTCEFCLNAIANEFLIRSADGREFVVGSDCVMKLDRDDNRLVAEVERHVKAIERAAARKRTEARKAKERDRIAATMARLDDPLIAERLAAIPHPSGYRDRASGYPLSLANYVAWMLRNAGHSGRLATARIIDRALS